jgi:hypothetical protein
VKNMANPEEGSGPNARGLRTVDVIWQPREPRGGERRGRLRGKRKKGRSPK